MIQLNTISYPKDFVSPTTRVAGDDTINQLIKRLKMEQDHFVSTMDTLVILDATGYVEVYKLAASCRVEVDW